VGEVNTIARSLLSYASHYGAEEKAAADAAAAPEEWMDFGASRATSIVACVPAFMDASGKSAGACSRLLLHWKHTRRCCVAKHGNHSMAAMKRQVACTVVTQCCDRVPGDGRPLQRGASMTTTEHVDPAAMPSVDPELDDDGNPSDVRLLFDINHS